MGRILYLCSQESDYLQDLFYQGLISLLGSEQVIEWPWNWSYHISRKAYPRNLGYPEGAVWQILPEGFDHLKGLKHLQWSEVSLVIVASCKPDVFHTYLNFQKQIPSSVPVIFLDGGDFPELGGDLWRLGKPELYLEAIKQRPFDFIFKREKLLQKDYPNNVAPLPFAVPSKKIPPIDFSELDRKYQVTFWAVESDPVRTQALKLIEDHFDCRSNGTTRNQTFKKYKRKGDFYLEELARSRVILNFRGVGWDTLRYWEVFGLSRFLISQRPQIDIPDNFIHGEEIIFCKDDLSDLLELISHYLVSVEERESIAQRGAEKARRSHTETARVQYFFKILGEKKIL
jgi:hypothetical protein